MAFLFWLIVAIVAVNVIGPFLSIDRVRGYFVFHESNCPQSTETESGMAEPENKNGMSKLERVMAGIVFALIAANLALIDFCLIWSIQDHHWKH